MSTLTKRHQEPKVCLRLFTWVWELQSIHFHQSLKVYVLHVAGVIAAAALKCMGGTMQGRLWPRSDEERKKAEEAGYDISKVSLISILRLFLKLLQPWP